MKMANLWQNFVNKFFQYVPCLVVCLAFLPNGLVFGYTISSFVAERNVNPGLIEYGPMILGACWGFVLAVAMFLVKFLKNRIIYWHFDILLVAGVFNLIGSCFYFANGMDRVGAFISYLAHSMTFLAGFSYLHSIPSKGSRAILIATGCSVYLLGLAAAVSLIGTKYVVQIDESKPVIYVTFAALYLSMSVVTLAILIGVKVMNYLGTVECDLILDNEMKIANSNGTIFDKRKDIIKRIQFFYVTKNQQWNVTFLLLFTEAIQYALFIYYAFWFTMNDAVRLTDIGDIDLMFWIIFVGSVITPIVLIFVSAKISFVSYQICLITLTTLSMIICSSVATTVPFWLIIVFFGMSFANLQIVIIEVSPLRYTELLIYVSYALKLLSTSIVYYYFVSNSKNSYFYSTDESTLMAQGFVYVIISSLLALVVGMKVPRTHKTTLFDIQYGLLGIIFKKHQIEQLNVRWLNDGTIPTISRPGSN